MKKIHIYEVLELFGLDKEDLPEATPAPVPVMEKRLDEFKEKLKKAYRKKAHEYHPDKGGDEEKFRLLNNLYHDLIKNLRITPVRRPQPVVRVVRVYSSGTSTSTTTGWTTSYWDNSTTGGG
jgi:hypothetical protein